MRSLFQGKLRRSQQRKSRFPTSSARSWMDELPTSVAQCTRLGGPGETEWVQEGQSTNLEWGMEPGSNGKRGSLLELRGEGRLQRHSSLRAPPNMNEGTPSSYCFIQANTPEIKSPQSSRQTACWTRSHLYLLVHTYHNDIPKPGSRLISNPIATGSLNCHPAVGRLGAARLLLVAAQVHLSRDTPRLASSFDSPRLPVAPGQHHPFTSLVATAIPKPPYLDIHTDKALV